MSALAITLLRFGFLALLWLFVFAVVFTVRRDVFGTRVRARSSVQRTRSNKRSTPARGAQSAPPSLAESLAVIEGPLAGTRLALSNTAIIIGRSPDSSLVLDDGYASSRHARIYRDGERVILEDLNSTNGTWVNGVQIHEPTVLPAHTPVTIGKTVLEVQ